MIDQAYIEQLDKEVRVMNCLPYQKFMIKDWKKLRGHIDITGPFNYIEVDGCIAIILGTYTIESKKQFLFNSDIKRTQQVRYDFPPSMDIILSFMKRFNITYKDITLSSESDMRHGGIRWFWNVRVFNLSVEDVKNRRDGWWRFYNKEISTYYYAHLSDFYDMLKASKKYLPIAHDMNWVDSFEVSRDRVSYGEERSVSFNNKGLKNLESTDQQLALGFAIVEERLHDISLEETINMGLLQIIVSDAHILFSLKEKPTLLNSLSDWY